jgi:outer membrane immunogenic protein
MKRSMDKTVSTIGRLLAVWVALFFLAAVPAVSAQTLLERTEFGASYNYIHSNAPPGGCGCFSMNGASGWAGYNFTKNVALVGEFGIQHASNVNGTGSSLTLFSYAAGPRYTLHRFTRFEPFGQFLIGGGHANESPAVGNLVLSGSGNSFVLITGGGSDFVLNKRFKLRLLQADYYLTRYANGVNDHQNNLRIGVGVVIRFPK